MSKVKFKGFVNGKQYNCYDEYVTAKNAAIKVGVLSSCSEEWENLDECYCDKTECCGCKKEVKDCSCDCQESYPDNLRLLFEDCLTQEDAYQNTYPRKARGIKTVEFKNKVDAIRNYINDLDEYQLNEYLDDIDFILDILKADEESWEAERDSVQSDINDLIESLNECKGDLDINKRLQLAYTTFKNDAKEALKRKIAKDTLKEKEHQANQERLERECNKAADNLHTKQEVEFRETDKNKEEMVELHNAIGELNKAIEDLGKAAGFEVKELLDDDTIENILKLFGI